MEDLNTGFDEMSARKVTNLLLEDDVKIYKKFLPEIKKMNSASFKNMFYGNKNYNYKICNQCQFFLLLDKFDNFRTLLEEWYENQATYKYLKELWIKYICIESLRDKSEYEIQQFLISKRINFPSWPIQIKDRFLTICEIKMLFKIYQN